MNYRTLSLFTLLVTGNALGQGPLTPPGAPGAGMKTLAQIEPRTPITNIPMTITQPGSYYLTTNLTCAVANTNGITVLADRVTLDLNGFTLAGLGTPTVGDGIYQPTSQSDLWVRNGSVTRWPSGIGLNIAGEGGRVSDVHAFGNSVGILLGETALAEGCFCNSNTTTGLLMYWNSVAQRCTADRNGTSGFATGSGCQLVDCASYRNGSTGIYVGEGSLVVRCLVYDSGTHGIRAAQGSLVSECSVQYALNDGIYIPGNGVVERSTVAYAGHHGLTLSGGIVRDCLISGCATNGVVVWSATLVEGCVIKGCGYQGISVENDQNTIRNNQSSGHGSSGLFVHGKRNRVEGNDCAGNDYGLYFYDNGDGDRADNNIALRNTCANNTTANFFVGVSNRVATIDDTGAFAGANDNYSLP